MYFLDKIIKSDFGEIFIAKDEEQETYFMAKNICHILELVDEIKRTVSRLDDDEHILIKRNNITPISCMQDYLQAQNLGGGFNPPLKYNSQKSSLCVSMDLKKERTLKGCTKNVLPSFAFNS
jgi:hypothetical protein